MIKSERLIQVGANEFLMCAYALELGRFGENTPVTGGAGYSYPIPEANDIFTVGVLTEVLALPVNASAPQPPLPSGLRRAPPQYTKPLWSG